MLKRLMQFVLWVLAAETGGGLKVYTKRPLREERPPE
jgi:hypothetical protein